MENLAFIEGQVDEVENERNTMICQQEETNEEIFKLKLDINLLKAQSCEASRIREETMSSHLEQRLKSLKNLEAEIGQYKEEVSSLRYQLE